MGMAVTIERQPAERELSAQRAHWNPATAVTAAAAIYITARVAIAVWVGPHVHPDTTGYRDYPISFTGSSPRPWVVSSLLRLGDYPFIVLQAAVSAVAFLTLGYAIARTLIDRRIQAAAIVLFALLGLAPRVTAWDTMLLTESWALSMSAFLLACLIWIRRVPWWVTATVFTVWLFTRDAHLYLGVIVFVGVCVWGWRARRWVLPAALAVAMSWGYFAYTNDDTVEGLNVTMNVAWYAGSDVETFRWFHDRGMPVGDGFMDPDFIPRLYALYGQPEFRAWAEGDGQRVYAEYMASHPAFTLGALRYLFEPTDREAESLVDHPDTWIAETRGVPIWPDRAIAYTWLLVLGAVLGGLLVARRGRLDSRWVIPTVMVGSTVPHALLAYHAAPTEAARHGTVMAFTLTAACWWLVALAADVLLHATSNTTTASGSESRHESSDHHPVAAGRSNTTTEPPAESLQANASDHQPSVVAAASSVAQFPSDS